MAELPGDGRVAELTGQPPITVRSAQQSADADGTWWVWGTDQTGAKLSVAGSRDGGKTWTTGVVPQSLQSLYHLDVSVTAAPGALYTTVTDTIGHAGPTILSISRSVDGGLTWERQWQAGQGNQPVTVNGIPVTGADGKIHITDYGLVTWVSTGRPLAGTIRWSKAGYLSGLGSSDTVWLSPDGVQWRKIEIRPVQ
jgi:hypothetical protein